MGCGQSNNSQNDTKNPQKKQKKAKDYDELMGNVLPKQLIQDNNNQKYGLKKMVTSLNEEQEQQTNRQQQQQSQQSQFQQQSINQQQAKDNQDANAQQQDKRDRQSKKKQNKLRGGYEEGTDTQEKIQRVNRKIKHHDLQIIVKTLKEHSVFYALTDSDLESIVRSMFYCEVADQEFVFLQGDQAATYFILEKGRVQVIIDGQVKKELDQGVSFGELALLYNAPRSASIKCIGNCGFWALDRATFRKSVEEIMQKELPENRKYMEDVSFFNFMNAQQKDAISHGLISQKFQPGQNIVNEGDQADSFYMIKEGTVSIVKDNKELRKLHKGDSFGENALFQQSVRMASVRADTEVKVLALARDSITKILGDKVQIIVYNNLQRWAYDKSDLLKKLTKIQIEKITKSAVISNQAKGTVLFHKGQKADKIVIVLEGKLVDGDGKEVAGKGTLFGDKYLLNKYKDQTIDNDIQMGVDGVISQINVNDFMRNIKCSDGNVEAVLEKNKESHEQKMAALQDKPDYSHIQLEKLIYIKKLGNGQFGTVYLIVNSETNDSYALKSVSKAQVSEQNLEKHILQEKQVLELVNFPFIMTFYRTFKDQYSVYFLTKYIQGMELFDVIREIGLLSTTDSQYYVGSMILGMEYMHQRQIIYRDLKPENIMVDKQGHMYIIDLGTAKILNSQRNHGRTFTIIGTPHYMAPEVVQGKGYGLNVDLWSIGVCLYEFMCGGVPYAEDLEDPFEIYNEIMKADVQFPQFMKDKKAKRLIEQLLSKVPEVRLGGSYAALKAHPWFDNFDWDALYEKKLAPPYKPPEDHINQEIKNMMAQGIPVINEIAKDQKNFKKAKTSKKEKKIDWDSEF